MADLDLEALEELMKVSLITLTLIARGESQQARSWWCSLSVRW
jgi:hypothetical protein